MQFIENIFLLQCLEKEIATAKELDLRLLGKVIIFCDKQTDKQNLPIIYRLLLMLILPLSSPIGENVSLLGQPSSVQCYARDNRGWTTFDDDHHLAFNR